MQITQPLVEERFLNSVLAQIALISISCCLRPTSLPTDNTNTRQCVCLVMLAEVNHESKVNYVNMGPSDQVHNLMFAILSQSHGKKPEGSLSSAKSSLVNGNDHIFRSTRNIFPKKLPTKSPLKVPFTKVLMSMDLNNSINSSYQRNIFYLVPSL